MILEGGDLIPGVGWDCSSCVTPRGSRAGLVSHLRATGAGRPLPALCVSFVPRQAEPGVLGLRAAWVGGGGGWDPCTRPSPTPPPPSPFAFSSSPVSRAPSEQTHPARPQCPARPTWLLPTGWELLPQPPHHVQAAGGNFSQTCLGTGAGFLQQDLKFSNSMIAAPSWCQDPPPPQPGEPGACSHVSTGVRGELIHSGVVSPPFHQTLVRESSSLPWTRPWMGPCLDGYPHK